MRAAALLLVAILAAAGAAELSLARHGADSLRLTVSNPAGDRLALQRSLDLTNWSTLAASGAASWEFVDCGALLFPRSFYRVTLCPDCPELPPWPPCP